MNKEYSMKYEIWLKKTEFRQIALHKIKKLQSSKFNVGGNKIQR